MASVFSRCGQCPEGDWEHTWDAAYGDNPDPQTRRIGDRMRADCSIDEQCRDALGIDEQRRLYEALTNIVGAGVGGGLGSTASPVPVLSVLTGAVGGSLGASLEEFLNYLAEESVWSSLEQQCREELYERAFRTLPPMNLPPVRINLGSGGAVTVDEIHIEGRVRRPQPRPTPRSRPPVRIRPGNAEECPCPRVIIHNEASNVGGDVIQTVTAELLVPEAGSDSLTEFAGAAFKIDMTERLERLDGWFDRDMIYLSLGERSDADIVFSPLAKPEPANMLDGRLMFFLPHEK